MTSVGLRASRDPQQVAPASRLVADRQAAKYEALIRRHARGRLLDLGCGSAPLYGTYSTCVDDVVCADWPSGLHGADYLDLHLDVNRPLPFRSGAFDTVLLTDVLEHVAEPNLLWSEIARVLGPGGHLILGVPFLYWIHEAPHDYYRYTRFALVRSCERAGLTVVSIEAVAGAVTVLLDIAAKAAPHGGATALIGSMGQLALKIPPLARLDRRSRDNFPIGYVLVATRT